MSGKKSFKSNNPALSFISAHDAPNTQEERETIDPISKTTQGKKGQKLPRINMAFSPENLEHIQIMGRVMGCSATEYVNRLIAADREQRGEIVTQANKLFTEVKK